MKLLIGGSPCTHWSIAQTKNRETETNGVGWELFLNYRIARDKYRPDYFLYENNKSMSTTIRVQITKELGVEPVLINSALVSAQNRQRLYWVGQRNPDGTYSQVDIEPPEDHGILLRDVLETGEARREKTNSLTTVQKDNIVTIPICVNSKSGRGGVDGLQPSLSDRIYSDEGKMTAVTVAYHPNVAIPLKYNVTGIEKNVYEVRDEKIIMNEKSYPIKLADGFYTIRKLTVTECKRLQTVPDAYEFPVSNSQAYKMLGNGWTVDVIAHIMRHFDGLIGEPVEVLSMYDGMSCGHIALDKLGANVTTYYATEIDKYAIQTTQYNYPETIQIGDAFQVREDGWKL